MVRLANALGLIERTCGDAMLSPDRNLETGLDDIDFDYLLKQLGSYSARLVRCLGYFLIAVCLLWANQMNVPFSWSVALAIGILGFGSKSARIGLLAISLLLFMAIFPVEYLQAMS